MKAHNENGILIAHFLEPGEACVEVMEKRKPLTHHTASNLLCDNERKIRGTESEPDICVLQIWYTTDWIQIGMWLDINCGVQAPAFSIF